MFRLTLLLPGLLGSFTGLPEDEKPKFTALETLLARAGIRKIPQRSFYAGLCELFELARPAGGDLPLAPLGRLIDGAERPHGYWMRADPVHLAAGRDGVRLVDASSLAMTQHDAIIFAATLEGLFKEYGWKLEVPQPERWYVRLPEKPAITTVEVDFVSGRNIQTCLPAGPDSSQWLRITNEIQMSLHACEMNREREARGDLPVNGLWFWGAGCLPDILPRTWSRLYSDDPVAQGLAMLSGTEFRELGDGFNDVAGDFKGGGDVLVACLTALSGSNNQDINTWLDRLGKLEQAWFEPLLTAVDEKRLDELVLVTDGYRFTVNKYAFLRFWRRRRSVIDYAG